MTFAGKVRITVKEKIGPKTKRRVVNLEHAARVLEDRAVGTPPSDPATIYALNAVASVLRLKALNMRQVPGAKLAKMMEHILQAAKLEFEINLTD